jgi:hypothetical protein
MRLDPPVIGWLQYRGLVKRKSPSAKLRQRTLDEAGEKTSPWAILADHAEHEFRRDTSGRSPWWSCPEEKIDRFFVVLPQSRQTARFDQLSRLRWLYRLALGQPHQQDFIETVSQLPDDGRQRFTLCLSAWGREDDPVINRIKLTLFGETDRKSPKSS